MPADTTSSTTGSRPTKSNGKWKAAAQDQDDMQSQILESAKKAYDTVAEKVSHVVSGFNSNPTAYIRQYPVQAAIGGVVVGMILGMALSRRSVTR